MGENVTGGLLESSSLRCLLVGEYLVFQQLSEALMANSLCLQVTRPSTLTL